MSRRLTYQSLSVRGLSSLRNALLTLAASLCLIPLSSAFSGEQQGVAHRDGNESRTWTSFRNGGSSTVSESTKLPTRWSPSQGISWQVELPGYGQSTPIIFENKVLVTAVDGPNKESNLIVCIDRTSGEELWRVKHTSTLHGPSNFMHSRAAPTPVVDQNCVYAFFESGDLIAVGLNSGETRWERDLKEEIGSFKTNHGLGSSPAQSSGMLYLNLEHNGPSALVAIQKSDGRTMWKAERPSGSSWSSPVVMSRGGQEQVVVSSAGEVASYDANAGEELWKIGGLAGNSVPSPLVLGDQVFLGARMPEFGSNETAAKSNLSLRFEDDRPSPRVAWRSERCIADYSSPVACGDYLYLINGNGILGCLDKQTGTEKFRKRLGFTCWATPITDGKHLFVFGKNGSASVIRAGDTFDIVSENHLWDSENPPKPVSYQEFFPPRQGSNHGHGASQQHSSNSSASNDQPGHPKSRQPGSGMLAGLMKGDADGNGVLSGDEIPRRLISVMQNIDLNQDGELDREELQKMAESFAAKRKGSRQSSRDPIVYGVAADADGFLIRTGTRLYSVSNEVNE